MGWSDGDGDEREDDQGRGHAHIYTQHKIHTRLSSSSSYALGGRQQQRGVVQRPQVLGMKHREVHLRVPMLIDFVVHFVVVFVVIFGEWAVSSGPFAGAREARRT